MPSKASKKPVDPNREPSRVVTLAEVLHWLNRELAPVRITEHTFFGWIERGYFPGGIALGGERSHGKAHRVVWLVSDVEAFFDGLANQPRLKAPKTAWGSAKGATPREPAQAPA